MADYRRLPGAVHDRWQWQEFGACRAQPPTVFFHPEAERGPRRSHRDAVAKAVCQRCPVIAQCREYALHVEEPYGVWGGLSEEERQALLRARRRTESGPAAVRSGEHPAVTA